MPEQSEVQPDLDIEGTEGRHRSARHAEGVNDSTEYEPRHLDDEYRPQHTAENDIDEDRMSPEDREALAEDERNRFTDRELLHGSRVVAATITEYGVKSTSKVLRAWAAVRNGAESPRRGFRNFLVSRAENKVAKRARKLDMAQDGVYKDYAQGRLEKAQGKLQGRRKKHSESVNNASVRVENANNYRSSEHQKFVSHLLEKKGAALLRKEARHRLRAQGASRWRSRQLSKEITTSDNAKNAINLALVARANKADYRADSKAHKWHSRQYEGAMTKMTKAESKYNKAMDAQDRLTREITELEEMLPGAREELDVATAELEGIEEGSVGRIAAEERYNAASATYHRYDAELRDKKLQEKDYRRQMKRQLGKFERQNQVRKEQGEHRRVASANVHDSKDHYRNVSGAASEALDELLNPETPQEDTVEEQNQQENENTKE